MIALSLGCVVFLRPWPSQAADVPSRSASGQTLCVPEEQKTLGEVYYVLAGAGTQLTWQTDSPLLRVGATCNRVVGYWVAPFDMENGKPPLFAGAMRVPVASFVTGYFQYDAALHGADGFNLAEHPEILVSFVSASPARNVVFEDIRERCEFTLVGELTIKGKKVRFESPVHMATHPFSRPTEQFHPSDLLILRMKFSLSLEEMGITFDTGFGTGFPSKNAEWELSLVCTTLRPEKNLDPRVNDERYVKHLQFMTQLRDFNNPSEAYAIGRAFMKESWDDSRMLNELALGILTDEHVKRKDLHFIEQAAKRANELSEHKDPQHLNTLALLYYERGDVNSAVKWARKAVENLEGQPFFVGPPIRAALAAYEAEAETLAKTTAAKENPATEKKPVGNKEPATKETTTPAKK